MRGRTQVAGLCEAHYIDLMPHNPLGPLSTAANVHFAAAIPNYAWLEDRPECAAGLGVGSAPRNAVGMATLGLEN